MQTTIKSPFDWMGEPSIFTSDKNFNGVHTRNSNEATKRMEETGATVAITINKGRRTNKELQRERGGVPVSDFKRTPTRINHKKPQIALPNSSKSPEPKMMKRRA